MKLPLKRSLATETRSVILEAIQSGTWQTYLPGERQLCERFQISRPTLRQALRQLEIEQVVSNQHGHRRRIIKKISSKPPPAAKATIGFLSPESTKEMFGYSGRKIAAIEYHIHQKEIGFELHVRPGCYTKSPAKALKTLLEETQIKYWILQQTNLEMQLWFQKNQIPVVITGTRYDGIDLPYIDLDNASVCRHAVGLLMAKKRKSICYLTSSNPLPGDLLSETGFMQGIENGRGIRGKIARSNGTPEGIKRKLEAILESPYRPDAFIIDKSRHAFCVASYLLGKGYRIPDDFSLVCRTESLDFQFMNPSIAHYSRIIHELAKRTADWAIKLTHGENLDSRGALIIPDFVPGQSL